MEGMGESLTNLIQAPDYQQIKQNFLHELTLASQDKPSSLSFIKHQIPNKPLLTKGIVQGIVIGGTNFILSTEGITNKNTRKILKRETGILPTFTSKQRFADFLIEHLDPHSDAIGINFGFKLEPMQGENGTLDGIVIAKGTKDHTFTGLTESVGTLVSNIFTQKYHKKIIIAVANDTISLILSGNGKEQASIVVGTGFNMGLRINHTTLVNLETGGFDKFPYSDVLSEIDSQTKNPGRKLFEKCISGMYLPKHFNSWARRLEITVPPVRTGQELTAIAHAYHEESARDLARIVLTQSAGFIAAALAGLYTFSVNQRIVLPDSALEILGEGGLLWDGWHYHEDINKYLSALGVPANMITIKHIKDSGINGAIGLITK